MAFRHDLGMLRPARRRADGSVVVDAHITRAGIFTYMNPDGSLRRELRDPSEVFKADSMRSFDMLTVTNTHPYQMVTAANARQFMVGASSKVERDDDHLRTELMVADAATVSEMESGEKAQVSCGYTCDYDPTPGVHPVWGRYDGRQTNIRGNHIALVTHARAGETARVRMDASPELRKDYAVMATNGAVLTSVVDGHQHSFDPASVRNGAGYTSWSMSSGADTPHSHEVVRKSDGSFTVSVNDGHTHTLEGLTVEVSDAAPKFSKGDRVAALASHMPGMKGMKGTIAIAREGTPPYYGVKFDDQKAMPGVHKWLAEDEVESSSDEPAASMPGMKADARNAPPMNAPAPRAKEIGMPTGKDTKTITIEAATAELAKETQRADAAIAEVAELKKSVTEQTARADAAEGALAVAREKIEELQSSAITQEKFDAEVAKVADLQKQLAAEKLRADTAEDPKRRALEVQDRARIESAVHRVLGENFKCDGLDNKALMTEVVKKLGKAPAADESEASIRARFDERIGNFDASEAAIARVRQAAHVNGQQQRVDSVDDVKRRAEEKRRNAWQSEAAK